MIVGLVALLFVGMLVSPNQPTTTTAAAPSSAVPVAPSPTLVQAVEPPAPPLPHAPAKAITAREWQLIAKNPDAHAGERVIVYGQVRQFDAATGTGGFRANVDGVAHKPKYGFVDYDTNTVLVGSEDLLANVVQGDLFTAETTVAGSMSYGTAIGGSTVVPQLTITAINVTGHLD